MEKDHWEATLLMEENQRLEEHKMEDILRVENVQKMEEIQKKELMSLTNRLKEMEGKWEMLYQQHQQVSSLI